MFIAAILKPEGTTHRVVRNLLMVTEVYAPEVLLEETEKHLVELAVKKDVPLKELQARMKLLEQAIRFVPASQYERYLGAAVKLVKDLGDKWFAALALHLREHHKQVVILTYNKRDYKVAELQRENVIVLAPGEVNQANI